MTRSELALLLCLGSFLALISGSAEQQGPGPGAFRRLYVLQPGSAAGADRGLRVSSISTRPGQPQTYNLELNAKFDGQVRTRRMGSQAGSDPQQTEQSLKLSGVNVCGGHCCHGWSKAQGSQRCTKPNCIPQCQNGGMCLRPQLCVCKPGSSGKACELKPAPAHPAPALPGGGATSGHNGAHTNGHNVVPQRPIPQQAVPGGHGSVPAPNMAQMKLTVKPAPQHVRPRYVQQQIWPVHPGQSQQYVSKPKYYHTQTHLQPRPERPIPLSAGHNPILVGNHTGRIKVVFTPTICKLTCVGGRCHNNCEQGNTTTIISENGHATDTLTAPNFRVVVCHLPCINGGKCGARDKCQCPPNFTGKFCQMQVHSGHQQQMTGSYGQTQVHSTHTLPLTYSNSQGQAYGPNIVNIHIKHPPEASVQVHQVSQLDNFHNNGHKLKGSQSGSSSSTTYTYHHSESSQKIQHHGYNILYPGQQGYQVPQYQPVASKNALGRCFQETAGSQCGKALPGLTKQDQCCGSMGTSWGFHKCQKCPKKPSIPLRDCPHGYKRINSSYCQDVDECQLPGVCPNGNCMNTVGSYRCHCKPGFIPDPTLSTCISNTPAVHEEKGACFLLVISGRQCLHPVSVQLSRQLCCCSVGKAWGPHCDKCPPPGTAQFKEICPGGRGYTVLPNPPFNKPVHQVPTEPVTPEPQPAPERPVELPPEEIPAPPTTAVSPQELVSSSRGAEALLPQLTAGLSTVKMQVAYPEVIERSSPPAPVEILPSKASQDIAPTQSAEVDECLVNPYICGQGVCYNTVQGYTCHCDEGFHSDGEQSTCVDVDECAQSPSLCYGGRCRNTEGGFVCDCPRGFIVHENGTSCVDVDECAAQTPCPSGLCINTPGGYKCESCPPGFTGLGGQCVDVDECQDQRMCTRGHCRNTEGSFMCECVPGFRLSTTSQHHCEDVDECSELPDTCDSVGECVNTVGSYTCNCPSGYRQVNGTSCRDVDECVEEPELCSPHGECRNQEGSYMCVCESGFSTNLDSPSCDDIDECGLNETLCSPHGFCENRLGTFRCLCDQGYQESADGRSCEDVNECELLSSVCGEAQCVNVDGSFLCVCPSGQEYNVMVAKCEPLPTASSVERKECYFRLNDENLCESVLTSHVTLEECCCTLGAGWGDNCEVHPCPVNGTDQFNQMCPSGRGFIPSQDLLYGVQAADSYKNADECTLFGEEVCKGGFCQDTVGSYECYCKSGQDYDTARLECRDIDECQDESLCAGGQCFNTDGSFLCFCTHPMELDASGTRCIFVPAAAAEQHEVEQLDYQGICWQTVTATMTCTEPLGPNRKTTYTECCCLHGEAWGMECALCPPKHTADYALMCNLPLGGGRRAYGRDALVAGPVLEYEVSPDYSPSPERLPPFYDSEEHSYKAFEGLRAEECGILNGCENGRCVRVQEGYTCDCFDGYTLDLSRMACVDVNECSELNTRMSLCKNAKCVNTAGSYQCVCLPGFTASDKPNYCVAARRTSQ
ncbi:latent-transforming growth factor beta-binding protein 1 isoform X1 [Synchiropus splendidus]|uniref:latent-transforming growth factor beta-binding protein 1 isoform X1 n=1 Tax=Synchiropus splendidus TaxID=270530 RepID=UPI00237DBFDC|nr:latent-transforming growth factor beta-binding protein 1 isoform X1 [Synchiropus splendidus]